MNASKLTNKHIVHRRETQVSDWYETMNGDDSDQLARIRENLCEHDLDFWTDIADAELKSLLESVIIVAYQNGWDPKTAEGLLQAARYINRVTLAEKQRQEVQAGAA